MATTFFAPAMADVDILTGAIGLEQQAQFAYGAGAKSGLLSADVVKVATAIADQHKQHEAALTAAVTKLGGTVPTAATSYPNLNLGTLKTQEDVLKLALMLEVQAANAYFDAFTKLTDVGLKNAGLSIMNDETQHVAILRSALGMDPMSSSFMPLK